MLLFPKPSALKEIYWDPKCNQKSGLYGSGVLGPPHLFTTLDGDVHKSLRKALSNAPVFPTHILFQMERRLIEWWIVDNWTTQEYLGIQN
jgi:hypothetical protein